MEIDVDLVKNFDETSNQIPALFREFVADQILLDLVKLQATINRNQNFLYSGMELVPLRW